VTKNPLVVLTVSWALACNGKEEMECPEVSGEYCETVGIPKEVGAAWCNECGTVYVCDSEYFQLRRTVFPCECITDEGYLELDREDHSSPCYQETW